MGGKTLKFPKRKKYTVPDVKFEDKEEEPVSEEEHQKRVKMLREMGVLK